MSFDLELVNSDLKIKSDGSVSTVTDTPKLRQDILKIILTPLGSNKFNPWYGCAIGENLIGKNLPFNLLVSQISSSISQSLTRLKALQQSQASFQRVTLAEMISNVGQINAGPNPIDPRQINVVVEVLTKSLTKIEEIFFMVA